VRESIKYCLAILGANVGRNTGKQHQSAKIDESQTILASLKYKTNKTQVNCFFYRCVGACCLDTEKKKL
jgi:hypothetical protein